MLALDVKLLFLKIRQQDVTDMEGMESMAVEQNVWI